MPLYNTTAIDLVERIARLLGDWKGGTCTGGGASTFADTTRTEADDYFQNTVPVSRVRIITTTDAAAPQGQERTMSDWVVSTGTGTVTAAWTTANPAAGDTYCIMSEYSWEEIFNAINDVIDSVKDIAVIEKADTSIVLASTVYEYDIPATFTHIYRVTMADAQGNYPETIDATNWKIIHGTPTPRLHLVRFPVNDIPNGWNYDAGYFADTELTVNRTLRLEGFCYQPLLVNDTDSCYLNPVYVINQTAADLLARRITRTDTDPKGSNVKYQIVQARANEFKPKAMTDFPPGTRRIYN